VESLMEAKEITKTMLIECQATGNFENLLSQLYAAGASAEQVGIYLASIGATTLNPEGFDAVLKALEVMAKFMQDGLGSVDPSELADARATLASMGFGG
jgi:hypothetical protein